MTSYKVGYLVGSLAKASMVAAAECHM
jgi:hypothetical protein